MELTTKKQGKIKQSYMMLHLNLMNGIHSVVFTDNPEKYKSEFKTATNCEIELSPYLDSVNYYVARLK